MKSVLNQVVSSPLGAFVVLVVAASLEVLGDSFFQSGLYRSSGAQRAMWFVAGRRGAGAVWVEREPAAVGLWQAAGSVCGAVLRGGAGGGEGAVSAIADGSDLGGRKFDRGGRAGDYLLERVGQRQGRRRRYPLPPAISDLKYSLHGNIWTLWQSDLLYAGAFALRGEAAGEKLCRPKCWRRHRLWAYRICVARLFVECIGLNIGVHVTVVTIAVKILNDSK